MDFNEKIEGIRDRLTDRIDIIANFEKFESDDLKCLKDLTVVIRDLDKILKNSVVMEQSRSLEGFIDSIRERSFISDK